MLTVNDIISSYNKFQENMLVIDYENHRTSANGNVKYFDIFLRKEDGLAPLKIKFFKQEVCNRIKGPEERNYDQIKICIKNKTPFTEALKLICESFDKIAQRDIDPDNLSAGQVPIACTKPNTPMQSNTANEEVKFKDPLFWIVPACKRTNAEYKDFDFRLFSLDLLDEETNSPKEIILNNKPVNDQNVHKVLQKGAIISGIISMQVIASKISFSLNTKISEKLFVKQPESHFNQLELMNMLS